MPLPKMICHCFQVSEEEIIDTAREQNLRDVDGISKTTRAGTHCRLCHKDIEATLDKAFDKEQNTEAGT